MTVLRLLNAQGIAGLAASLCLALLLVLQKGETRHWKKQSAQFEQLYRNEQAAFAGTVANYREAAEQARLADRANAERVRQDQLRINERISNGYEARLAAARAAADRLRQAGAAPADAGSRGGAAVPGLSAPAGEPHQAPGQNGLSVDDRLTATEQAIQLDELIEWVRRQAKIDNSGGSASSAGPGRR